MVTAGRGLGYAETLHTQAVLDALSMAIWRRRPDAVIHHSDKGCQPSGIAFGQRCAEAGVTPSTGSGGDCFDNAIAVSASGASSSTAPGSEPRHEATLAVMDYIEGFEAPAAGTPPSTTRASFADPPIET